MIRRSALAVAENIVVPLAVYFLLTAVGVTTIRALLGSAGASAAIVVFGWLRRRRVSVLGVLVGAKFLLALAIALIIGDVRLMLAKQALDVGASALLMLATVVVGTPLIARIHRSFAADVTSFDRRWAADEDFRADHRWVTATWGVALAVAALAVVGAAYLTPVGVAVVLTQVLPVPVYLALIGWTQAKWAGDTEPAAAGARDRGRTARRGT